MSIITEILPDLLQFWKGVLPYIFLGCYLGTLSSRTNFIHRLGFLMRPMARLGNLPQECAAPITLCMAGPVASYSMLAQLKKNGILNSRQVVVSTLIAAFPNGLYNTTFFILPAALAALGMRAGSLYLSVYMGMYVVISLGGILVGKVLLQKPIYNSFHYREERREAAPWKERLTGAFKGALPLFGRIVAVFIPATFIMTILINSEITSQVFAPVEPFLAQLGLPAHLILVITTGMVSTIGAMGMIGPLIQSGTITLMEMVVALLLAFVLHWIYEFWSYLLPCNVSIFGGRLGWKVSLAILAAWEATLVLFLSVTFLVK